MWYENGEEEEDASYRIWNSLIAYNVSGTVFLATLKFLSATSRKH